MKYWNEQGFIPPVLDSNPVGKLRSPYEITLTDFYTLFSNISEKRKKLLNNFLTYRKALHDNGITDGYQWINGSFLMNIEKIEDRPPNDIDIVTFVYSHDLEREDSINNFISSNIIKELNMDAYHIFLQGESADFIVSQTTYWYSMWSHTRDYQWKGFFQINLDPAEDIALTEYLNGGVNEH